MDGLAHSHFCHVLEVCRCKELKGLLSYMEKVEYNGRRGPMAQRPFTSRRVAGEEATTQAARTSDCL